MEKENKRLNQVAFFNMLGPILLNGISFFTIPIFTRLLGTDNYGMYTVYNSYQSLLVIFMGLQTQAIVAPTSVYYEGEKRDRCFSNALCISLCACAVFALLCAVFMPYITTFSGFSSRIVWLMLAHTTGMVGVQWALFKFSYDRQAKTNFALSTSIAVCSVLLSLLLIKVVLREQQPYIGYVLGHAVPYILVGVVMFAYFLRKGRSYFSKAEWKFCLGLCLPLIFHALSNTLLHQCDKIMVQKMMDESAAGIYGFAVTFANVLNIIYTTLNTTWVPFYHDDVKAGDMERLRRKTNNYVFLFTGLTIGFIMMMPEVVKQFVQEDFWPSIRLIPLLSVGIYFVFLYSFPVNFEFYYRRTKNIAMGTSMACLANVALNFLLIRRFGMIGAATATLLAYVLLYVFHLIMAKWVIRETYHYPYRFFHVYMLIVLGMGGLFYLLVDHPLVRWSIAAVTAALMLIRVWRNKSIF